MMKNIDQDVQLEIPGEVVKEWQNIVDIMATLIGVPAGLIMRVLDPHIEVFVSSRAPQNPYHSGAKEILYGSGLYCEEVIKTKNKLLVPNALLDEKWKNNPGVKLNIISYLGFPILLPDGKTFGTICVLDDKENHYSDTFVSLLQKFREIIESNLHLLYWNQVLGEKNKGVLDFVDEIIALRGIMPMCMYCKDIRNDKGYWERVDEYISNHTEADFSHGLCPKCLKKHYPDLADQILQSE